MMETIVKPGASSSVTSALTAPGFTFFTTPGSVLRALIFIENPLSNLNYVRLTTASALGYASRAAEYCRNMPRNIPLRFPNQLSESTVVRRRPRCGVSAVLVAFAALLACAAPAIAQTRVTDDAKRTVTLPASVSRVFAAGAPAEVLLYTLVPEKMVGRNHMPSPAALEFMPPEYRNPTPISLLPNANDDRKDKELVSLRPDVYVDYGDVKVDYVNSLNNVQSRTGIPGIILDGGLQQIPSAYRRLGVALEVKNKGDQVAKTVEQLLAKYRSVLKKKGKAPRAYLACSGDNVIPCLSEQRSGEVLDFIGAVNVAGTGASAPMRPVTADDLKSWDPDAIVVSSKESAARIRNDADWQSLRAVTEHRLYAFP